jgi:hypothetical protein
MNNVYLVRRRTPLIGVDAEPWWNNDGEADTIGAHQWVNGAVRTCGMVTWSKDMKVIVDVFWRRLRSTGLDLVRLVSVKHYPLAITFSTLPISHMLFFFYENVHEIFGLYNPKSDRHFCKTKNRAFEKWIGWER